MWERLDRAETFDQPSLIPPWRRRIQLVDRRSLLCGRNGEGGGTTDGCKGIGIDEGSAPIVQGQDGKRGEVNAYNRRGRRGPVHLHVGQELAGRAVIVIVLMVMRMRVSLKIIAQRSQE